MYKEADQFGTYTAIPGSKPVNRYVSNSTYDLSNSWYARQMDRNLRNTTTGKSHPEISPTVAATNLSVTKRPGMRGVVDDPLLDRVAEQQQQAANNIMQQRQLRPTPEQQQYINRFWNESSFYNRRNAKGQAFDLQEPVLDQSITDPDMRQIVIDTGKGMANNTVQNSRYGQTKHSTESIAVNKKTASVLGAIRSITPQTLLAVAMGLRGYK